MKKKYGWREGRMGILVLLLAVAWVVAGCEKSSSSSSNALVVSSHSYKGHASDADINNFVQVYPRVVGKRLDDCQTCHTGGTVMTTPKPGQGDVAVYKNPCDWCHYLPFPPMLTGDSVQGNPTDTLQTLNPYGREYLEAGRDKPALRHIKDEDSDGDGYSNQAEIKALTYPGDPNNYPGQKQCAYLTVTMKEIQAIPSHTQFGLANATKQQFDTYATFTGVKIKDLLAAEKIDLTGATGIDILAPDGFAQSFSMDQINDQFPAHQFFPGFGVDDLGSDCAFVDYPAETYGYGYGDMITDEQWHLLAYQREGLPLDPSYLDPASGKIDGEGPLRNIYPPDNTTDPTMNQPDRGKNWDTSGCTMPEWDYNPAKSHNAFWMVKGTVIFRIQPMPTDCQEFDIENGGWAMIDAGQLLIYGHGVSDQ